MTKKEIYVCENCGYSDELRNLKAAENIELRLAPGDIYTDVERPECHALCQPAGETKAFFETLILVRILSDRDPGSVDSLDDVGGMIRESYDGDFVGELVMSDIQEIDSELMAARLMAAGSEPGFFQIDQEIDNMDEDTFLAAKEAMAALGIPMPLRAAFSETEMSELLEIARVALCNADLFDHMADKLDLSDDYMIALRDKVNALTSDEDFEEQNT
jgi:hypothetical protein